MRVKMETHKMSDAEDPPYAEFGRLLADLRLKVGIASQSEFASLLRSTQQTVSRWEAGRSRPRDKQMPIIAAAVKVDLTTLLAAAGLSRKSAAVSFDQPFPMDALTPESFERFCRHLLDVMYPEARIYRAGSQGHKQDGLDINADFPDGAKYTFQCKRTDDFGPQKVHAAVAKHTVAADKKILLLSRIVSPQARAAAHQHPGWEMWDKDDISQKIRRLPLEEQVRLVDIFFKGQRFALLGVDEAGPWETSKEFFAAFANPDGIFSHVWDLVGRKTDLADLNQALFDERLSAVLLIGAGGSGKTRILKQAIEKFESGKKCSVIRFLSRNVEITKKSLEDLGSRSKLLVVDDAHDQSDLQLLFQYAADPSNKAKLVLVFRPYGLDHIKAQAANFSLAGPTLKEIPLSPLTLEETEELATQALKKHSGPVNAARDIARLTRDCPLATVVGAYIVSKEKRLIDLVQNEGAFRSVLFARFQDVIAGEIGSKSEAETFKKILRILALLQPFHPEDKTLFDIIREIEKIAPHDASRILRLLTEAGVLFKRGSKYRLSPDVLADYIVEANCVGPEGVSSGYAESVFDLANEQQAENLLINLSRLDWRRSNGDPSNSKLIDGVWSKLRPDEEHFISHLKAVEAVAYYQPLKAVELVERLIRENRLSEQLPRILRYVAYNFNHLTRSCEDLWELGKHDSRPLFRHPDHPIRILAELCEVRPNKPFEYNERVVNFGVNLLKESSAWNYSYSPLDILKPIFKTEGHTTSSKNFSLSLNPYFILAEFVAPLRRRVLDQIIELLFDGDVRKAVAAAEALADAFCYPMGLFNAVVSPETRDQWTELFCEGLESIEAAIRAETIDPLVFIAVCRSIQWHADYASGPTSIVARRIKRLQPNTLIYRTLKVLIDGHGVELRRIEPKDHEKRWAAHVDELAEDLIYAYPDGDALRVFVGEQLAHLSKGYKSGTSTFVLNRALIRASAGYANALIESALSGVDTETLHFVPLGLEDLWRRNVPDGRAAAARLVVTGREDLRAAVAQAYDTFFCCGDYNDEDIKLFESLISAESTWVARCAINSLRRLSDNNPDLQLKLARVANIGSSNELADELLALFTWNDQFNRLSTEDVSIILEKLMAVRELYGHWIQEFLATASKLYPERTVAFFMQRVELAAENEDWDYRPCNHGPYGHVSLRFRECAEYPDLLKKVAEWMKSGGRQNFLFSYRSLELFETMFGPFDAEVMKILNEWAVAANAEDLELVGNIVAKTNHGFVFDHQAFVEKFLNKAAQVGPDALKAAFRSLYGAAISGLRSGTPGEPTPRDVETKRKCEAILQMLPRFSSAFEFYENLRKDAENGIAESL
jgi:transcriptional regulator with XRE-family HTH domain